MRNRIPRSLAARQPIRRSFKLRIRFDSLSREDGARSVRFEGLVEEIVCRELDQVMPVLRRLDEAVARGHHAAGFVSYEAAPAMDAPLAAHPASGGLPLLHFGIYERRVEGPPLGGLVAGNYSLGRPEPQLDIDSYRPRILEIQRLIAAGDTYQVNFTFAMKAAFEGSPAGLYRDLCRSQTAGYCALIELDEASIVSASPELFFRRTGDGIELRPMKGTRPRGRWSEEDDELAAELEQSAKDRAENLMIVDLLRNDLGRVAEVGSVAVPDLFRVERYPTVHQMVSTVTGRVPAQVGTSDLFRALFPSGSVTGAPKIRTTEIIHHLERGPRGIYTGAVGFMSPDVVTFNVAIRTPVIHGDCLTLGVGSGITTDSDPDAEYRECLEKAEFLTRRRPPFRLLESLRLEIPGGYPLLDRHLDRIGRSGDYFGYPIDREGTRTKLLEHAALQEQGLYKVRMLVGDDGAVEVESAAITESSEPIPIQLAPRPVSSRDPFLYHKTTHREAIATAAAGLSGAAEPLLVNERNELTEATRWNIVLEIGGELLTPSREAGLLAGVQRGEAIRSGQVREAILAPSDLQRADRIFLLNAVRGWREARLVE